MTRDDIIPVLQRAGREKGEWVCQAQWRHRRPSAETIRKVFGSWEAAWRAAGFPVPDRYAKGPLPSWTEDQMLGALRRAAMDLGRVTAPRYDAWRATHDGPSLSTLCRHFSSLRSALHESSLPTRPVVPTAPEEEPILSVRLRQLREADLAGLEGRALLVAEKAREVRTMSALAKALGLSASVASLWVTKALRRTRALRGAQTRRESPLRSRSWSRERILEALRKVYESERRVPSLDEWYREERKPSHAAILLRFKSWTKAWEEACGVGTGADTVSPQ